MKALILFQDLNYCTFIVCFSLEMCIIVLVTVFVVFLSTLQSEQGCTHLLTTFRPCYDQKNLMLLMFRSSSDSFCVFSPLMYTGAEQCVNTLNSSSLFISSCSSLSHDLSANKPQWNLQLNPESDCYMFTTLHLCVIPRHFIHNSLQNSSTSCLQCHQ